VRGNPTSFIFRNHKQALLFVLVERGPGKDTQFNTLKSCRAIEY
jgi:hypothetical protein